MKKTKSLWIILAIASLFLGGWMFLPVAVSATDYVCTLEGDGLNVIGGLGPDKWAIELQSIGAVDGTYSDVKCTFQKKLKFKDISKLSAWFNVTATDCGGGSPRFSIAIDMNGDGTFTQPTDGHVFVYFGPYPNFYDCPFGWQSTGNLIGNTDLRFDLSQVGGPWYGSYADALALLGNKRVLYISLNVDSGWWLARFPRGQVVQFDNIWINNINVKFDP